MDPVQLAAVLAGVILLASVISVELGVTVALLELSLGVVAGNAFHLHSQEWLDFIASFASIVTFLAGMEVDPDYLRKPREVDRGDRRRVVRRPVRRRLSRRLLRPRLVGQGVVDRGHRALDHVARCRLRGPARARAHRHGDRQAPDELDVRHRPLHGGRALGDLHHAEPLVPGLSRAPRSR